MIGITHAHGRTLDLLMTDVPDLVRVAVVAPLGSSDHSSLSISISKAQAILNLCVSNRVILKHPINWSSISYRNGCTINRLTIKQTNVLVTHTGWAGYTINRLTC